MAIGTKKVKGMIYHWSRRPMVGKLFFFFVVTATVLLYVAVDAEEAEKMSGRWRTYRGSSEVALTDEQKIAIKQLESLGYVAGSKPAPSQKGVTIYDRDKAYNGLNLYVSGHAPEAILMDMDGKELHKWSYDFERIWPNFKPTSIHDSREFWRRVHLFDNGDLLAIFEGIGLLKLDKDSNLLWVYRGNAHHDLYVAGDGRIYVLTRKAKIDTNYSVDMPILEDFITVLDSEGKELKSVFVLRALENSYYAPLLATRKKKDGDMLHTNTIEVLDGKLMHNSPAFCDGNVLISILRLNCICVINMETECVEWALSGLWEGQHQPTVIGKNNMLIFDNKGNNGKSRVLEFNPFSQEIFWTYSGGEDSLFYSATCGSCARLPNGNTLITETDNGRGFEVTKDNRIVWEFVNPKRAGNDRELIASLFEIIRIGPEKSFKWLAKVADTD